MPLRQKLHEFRQSYGKTYHDLPENGLNPEQRNLAHSALLAGGLASGGAIAGLLLRNPAKKESIRAVANKIAGARARSRVRQNAMKTQHNDEMMRASVEGSRMRANRGKAEYKAAQKAAPKVETAKAPIAVTKPAGRGTVERLAKATAIREERGYGAFKSMDKWQRSRFAKLSPEIREQAGRAEGVARDAGGVLSPGERQKARGYYGALRKAHNFAVRYQLRHFAFVDNEAGVPLTGRIARDRYVKKIRDEDLNRRDANIGKAGAAGAVAGMLVPAHSSSLLKRSLIGGSIGAAGVLGIRAITSRHRDVYGERSREGKLAEKAPAGVATAAAVGLLAHRIGKGRRFSAKFFERKKDSSWSPAVKTGISAAVSGGALGLLPAFKKGVGAKAVFKSVGTAAGLGATLGGGGTYIGGKILGAPRKGEGAPITKRAALGSAIAGSVLGGGAVIAARRGVRLPFIGKLDEAAQTLRPAEWLQKAPAPIAVAGGALGLGTIAGAHAADEGQQVDTLDSLRRDRRATGKLFSSDELFRKAAELAKLKKKKPWLFKETTYGPPSDPAPEGHFKKLIDDLKKKLDEDGGGKGKQLARFVRGMRYFGYANQPRIDDAFFDPATGEQKKGHLHGRFENIVRHSYGLGSQKLLPNPDGSEATFHQAQYLRGFYNQGKHAHKWGQRIGRLGKDAGAVATGQPRSRDAAGRPMKREWEKSWFQKAVGSAVAGAALAGGAVVTTRTNWGRTNILPKVRKAEKWAAGKGYSFFASPLNRLRFFDDMAAYYGWDVRDPRGKSVRVFSPGSRRRMRRNAEWHETKDGQRKILTSVAALGVGTAALAGLALGRKSAGAKIIPRRKVPPKPSNVVQGTFKTGAA